MISGPQLPLQPLRRPLPILLLGDRGTMGVNSLPKTVTRLNRQTHINFYTQKLKRVTITKVHIINYQLITTSNKLPI